MEPIIQKLFIIGLEHIIFFLLFFLSLSNGQFSFLYFLEIWSLKNLNTPTLAKRKPVCDLKDKKKKKMVMRAKEIICKIIVSPAQQKKSCTRLNSSCFHPVTSHKVNFKISPKTIYKVAISKAYQQGPSFLQYKPLSISKIDD